MPASSQGLPTSGMRLIAPPHCGQCKLDGVDVGAVGGVALELVPAGDGARFQLLLVADDLVVRRSSAQTQMGSARPQ